MIEPADFEGGIVIEEDTLDTTSGCSEGCLEKCGADDCARASSARDVFRPPDDP